jgi:hypothetical protein
MAIGRKTGGRKAGSKNRRTLQIEAAGKDALEAVSAALGTDAFDGDAHALLAAVYKDLAKPIELRVDAAKAAIRYEKPALSSVDQKGNAVPQYIAYLPTGSATAEEWLAEHGHLKGETLKETKQ